MSTAEGGGNVVQDSLRYYLDASNPKSYAGGTYIQDLSRLQYSGGTLIGGASYSSSNQGCITFDGIDEYMSLDNNVAFGNNSISKYSFSMWISPTNLINSSNSNIYMIFEAQNTLAGGLTDNYIQITPSTLGKISFSTFNPPGNDLLTTTNVWEANKWYNITCTYDIATLIKSIYVNGVLENSNTASGCYFNTRHFFNLFAYSSPPKQWFFPGRLGSFMLYTKTLTATEVLQNYNAAKYKYI
jgi:Concanavalin A-like lectin/glucanases superfamily